MKKITVSILSLVMMLSMVFSSSVFAAEKTNPVAEFFAGIFNTEAASNDVGVEYRGHVQNKGDFPTDGSWIQGPDQLGTVGESLRLEAFWIKLTDAPEGLHIKYEVHVQNIGWMDPVEDGDMAGTEGDALRIEAIKISLVDDEGVASKDYAVAYKGHVQYQGDTKWYFNGEQLGTTGSGLRLEALEVQIEKIAPDLEAYEAALAAVTEANYTKASWAAYQDVVEANVMTEDNVQSEVDAATAIILDAQEDLVTVPVIAGMTASSQTTIAVSGKELGKLSPSMISVAGNTVSSVTASADGTTAIITVGTVLVPDTNVKVTATIDGTATEYTVKYTIAGKTVVIQDETFDNDLKNQELSVLVDGVETSYSYLLAQGYSVSYNAWNDSGVVVTSTLLSNGGIVVPATIGDYTAQVTIAKGSVVSTSNIANIKVRDLDNNANAITAYTLTNISPTGTTSDFKMNSKKFVVGETGQFTELVVGFGDAAAKATSGYDVTSANSAVISVNSTTGVMTAVGMGTADVTITYGQATYVVTLTVVGEKRQIATATAADFTSIKGAGAQTNTVTVIDQYGDPFVIASSVGAIAESLSFVGPSITGVATGGITSPVTVFTNAKGELGLTLNNTAATAGQTGVVVFRNKAGNVVGSFNVVTTDVNNTTIQKLVIASSSSSSDDVLNTDIETNITYEVALYNSNGVRNGTKAPLTNYSVTFNGDIIQVAGSTTAATSTSPLTLGSSDNTIIVTGLKAGSTTMVVKDNSGAVIDTRTVTVVKGAPYITGITFKDTSSVVNYASTVNYKNVLNLTEYTLDDVVNNVTLSTGTVYPIRIDEVGTVGTIGQLYLDKNSSGRYDTNDAILGTVGMTLTQTAGTTWTGTQAIAGQGVVAGDKGTVTFTVTDTVTSTNPIVGTSTVTVNVPSAVVSGSVTNGIVTGITGSALTAVDFTITLTGDTFGALTANDDVAAWITNLPTGCTAVVKNTISAGATQVVVTVAGTPTTTSTDALAITVPNASVAGASDITLIANPNAVFAIAAP